MRHPLTVLPLAALLLTAPARAEGPATAPLRLTVTGFQGTAGQAVVEVFADAGTWLKPGQGVTQQVVAISGSAVSVALALPPGSYAVSVYHDADRDGELDFRWLPPGPAEGSGVSNDAPALLGPPSFADSRFTLPAEGRALSIALRY